MGVNGSNLIIVSLLVAGLKCSGIVGSLLKKTLATGVTRWAQRFRVFRASISTVAVGGTPLALFPV